ncbi:MAG: tRNA (adenosine(37)-N6)-threonylcarbamoyltransferase complex ATPase subunit type 1 TsaE [Candidatus Marinimicrobia bacterium]|nr:tRNA (adenosine(37)-N6)-threonylcarbamoyltransferase complex ATPase subunit type 1 TsaE [Candidatus Neomarinimicrobiota bacterium]
MISKKILTRSSIQTKDLAKNMAKEIPIGTIVALIGELGSGKTTFAQGFAEGLHIFESIVSPTFKLVSEYEGEKCKLIHVDTYRLDSIEDFLNICGEDIIRTPGAIILIEWADKIIDILPPDTVQIHFQRVSKIENERELTINTLSE